MSEGAKILLIEDDSGISDTLQRVLAGEGHEVAVEKRGDDGLARAARDSFNVVITDLRLPGLGGLELIRQLRAAQPRLPIILTTAFGTTEIAIEATKLGAFDYLLKPFNMPQLLDLVQKAAGSNRLMSEPVALGETGTTRDALVGNGRRHAGDLQGNRAGRLQASQRPHPRRNWHGQGTDRARHLPAQRPRQRALHRHQLRGHSRNASGKRIIRPRTRRVHRRARRGALAGSSRPTSGTIFLDEIGDMTLGTQVKLVRVLQEKCLQRLGGKETIPVDARVIAATHRDLETAIRQKQFREDLYYRLNVVVITLPPLRQRPRRHPGPHPVFSAKHGPALGSASRPFIRKPSNFCKRKPGPATCANWKTSSAKPCFWRKTTPSISITSAPPWTRPTGPVCSADQSLRDYIDDLLAAARRGEIADAHAPGAGKRRAGIIRAAPSSRPKATRPKPPAGSASPASP